jgi:hypothetical protein
MVVLAGSGFAPLGVIELLFLFAPLVIVPLGLDLADRLVSGSLPSLEHAARILQPLAALSVVAAFCTRQGPFSAALATPWLVACLGVATSGAWSLVDREHWTIASLAVHLGRIDLVIGAAWLLISRSGVHVPSTQEPIVLLTAVHFHYTGFATALLGASAFQGSRATPRWIQALVLDVVLAPYIIAAGFVFSPFLKMFGVGLLSAGVIGIAQAQLRERTEITSAAAFLKMSSLAIFGGIALAVVYSVGEFLHRDWLTIPRMASIHGVLNALGFVLFGILGRLIEAHPKHHEVIDEGGNYRRYRIRRTPSGTEALAARARGRADRPRHASVRIGLTTFVAREFYDQ